MEAVLSRLGKSSEVMTLKVPHTMLNAWFVLLAKRIYYIIRILDRFDSGTKSKIGPLCGLARGNLQWPGVLGLSSEPKISGSIFWWI